MKYSDILSLVALFSSTSALPAPQACDGSCTCLTDPGSLGFDTQVECIAYAKDYRGPEWLEERDISLATRDDSDDSGDTCGSCDDFQCLGYGSFLECTNHYLPQDQTTSPSNSAEDYTYGSIVERKYAELCGEDPCTCYTNPGSFGFDTNEDCIDYAKENDYPEWLGKRDNSGGCENHPDLCLTFLAPDDVSSSLAVQYNMNTSLEVLIVGSSQVRVNPKADIQYDLTQCFFSGSNYPALDSANQPPQLPDKLSERPAVHLTEGYDDLYDIGPPQVLQMVNCPSPANS